MQRAIILAAGRGERLVNGHPYPKPLEPVAGVPLIVRVLRNLESAGVDEAVIVVGYLGEVLASALANYRFDLKLRLVYNDEWEKPNGTSLLKAGERVEGPTFLMMSDHLWSADLFEAVRRYPLAHDEAVLGIDFKIGQCCDLEDATKVALRGDRVLRIGKTLPSYEALDTGVFRITPALIDALREADGPDGCSLSAGVQKLASQGRMRVADVGSATWVDVDTPWAHAHAERLVRAYGDSLRPQPQVLGVAVAS